MTDKPIVELRVTQYIKKTDEGVEFTRYLMEFRRQGEVEFNQIPITTILESKKWL